MRIALRLRSDTMNRLIKMRIHPVVSRCQKQFGLGRNSQRELLTDCAKACDKRVNEKPMCVQNRRRSYVQAEPTSDRGERNPESRSACCRAVRWDRSPAQFWMIFVCCSASTIETRALLAVLQTMSGPNACFKQRHSLHPLTHGRTPLFSWHTLGRL
eukprot:549652-Prymnesium_polylepis.3